jgi:two-component system response regulator HydG
VAATNRDLEEEVRAGRFRQDLYYRLNVITLNMPSLREREGDIHLLASAFLERYAAKYKKTISGFNSPARQALLKHPWPGNVRELEHKVERAVIMCDGQQLEPNHLGLSEPEQPLEAGQESLKQAKLRLEKQYLSSALAACRGDITAAAKQLGVARPQVYRMMARHRIKPPK